MSLIELYKMFLYKEKFLYSNLNKLKKEEKLFLGFCWIPLADRESILRNIEGIKDKNRNIEIPTLKIVNEHGIKPPSLFRMNEFTNIFQEIVNTYGIPNYKEVNPSVFTCVTFPFLFGVMFGDIGHGGTLFFVGSLLCIFCEPIRAKAPGMEALLSLRYIILLMGLFACFCGLIYNDFMAIPLWIFNSCYKLVEGPVDPNHPIVPGHEAHIPMRAEVIPDCTYPIGIDPAWYLGLNELTFLNSLKMKLSVILGVLQMSLGICMKAFNATHFGNKIDFFFEFVPQIILMMCLFGYMDLLIIVKWCTDFETKQRVHHAPSIITSMIEMALNGGDVTEGFDPLLGSAKSQKVISILLLLTALICVPTMLFPKPFYLEKQKKLHAAHVDHKNNIPMQEHVKSADPESHKLLPGETPHRENLLQ
jgi:V-type H+-transporting ATPase subunit a